VCQSHDDVTRATIGESFEEAVRVVNIEIQVTLGIPRIDRKKSRQNVLQVFTVYRQYRGILHLGLTPLYTAARPEYEDAMDPSMIHGSGFGSREPKRGGGISESQIREWMMTEFIENVRNKVDRLKPDPREIICRRYLTDRDPQPTDTDVWMSIVDNGVYITERDYERKKADALIKLAYSFGVVAQEE
jgi:hypothetical protein